jgi:molybdopterin-guanine dinucleotide biosynthesis protein A
MWSAAILAGGRARRLGGLDKSALIVDGVAVIDRQLAVLRGRARNIVLVGFRGPGPAPCPVVDDLTPGAGPLGALVTALMSATTDRVFVLAGDMPFITAPFVEYLATLAHAARAVVPVSDGRWHPLCAMYARDAAAELSAALDAGERTVAAAVERLQPRLVTDDELAPFDRDGRLLANLNTPDDLARWGAQATRADT